MTDSIRLCMPISAEQARALKVGDTVLLDGDIVVSAGLPTYQRIADYVREGRELPINLNQGVLFHLGSYSRETPQGDLEVLYINPTTSTRFNPLMPGIIRGLGLHAVGGKGGLDAACAQAMKEAGCVYLSFPGGGSALLSEALRGVLQVAWPELITHYRLVKLRVQGLGPATVGIDAHGNSVYDALKDSSRERLQQIFKELDQDRARGL